MNDTSTGRLAGWKEIARYLNTSVRTAQRWEQELGLPVHHTGSSKGYSVFAFEEEFEAWLKRSKGNGVHIREQSGPATETDFETQASRLPLRKLLAIVAIAVVAPGGLFAVIRFRAGQTPKVSLVTFSGRQLLAWSNGKVLWSYDLGQMTRDLRPQDLNRTTHILPSGEVIAAAPLLQTEAGGSSTDAVYYLSSTGKLLWRHVFADRVHFGGEECGPQWIVGALMVTGDGAHWSAWCTVCSQPTSVSMVVNIDSSGNTARYFVNYGHLWRLSELWVPGGPYLLAGGINNESDDAALAVLAEGKPSGRSPQTGALSDCDSCPEGQPYRYFLFPRSEVIRVTGPPYNNVDGIAVMGSQIHVVTAEGREPEGGRWAVYNLSAGLVPKSVFFSDHYRFAHEQLSAEGKIKHTLAACPERLQPITVREWSSAEGWRNIALPPIESRVPNRLDSKELARK